jgi:O-antigen/teichoic acid export membrane protein
MEFRKAVIWSVLGQVASYLVFFGSSVIVARLLSPHEMGVFAISMSTIGILNILIAFDVGTYVVREKELRRSTVDSAFTINVVLSVFIAAGVCLTSFVTSNIFGSKDVGAVLLPLAVTPLIGMFEFRPGTMLRREMNFRALSLIGTAKAIVSTVVVVLLAIRGYSYMSLAYGTIASAVSGVLFCGVAARQHFSLKLSLSEGRQLLVFGFRMMSIGGLAILAQRLSDIVLGQLLGLAALGLYSRASNISVLIFQNIYGAMTRVIFVRLSNEFRATGMLGPVFLRSFEMIIALLWPIQAGLAVLSGPAIYILYGERWLGAALPLSLLMIAQCIALCFGMNWELFVLRNETARQTKFEAIRAVAGVAVFTVGCLFGISEAAIGRIIEALFGFFLYRPHVNRLAGIKSNELSGIFAKGIISTVAAVSPSFFLMIYNDWSPQTPMIEIVSSIVLGVVLWLATLASQGHPLMRELRKAIGGLRARLRRPQANAGSL